MNQSMIARTALMEVSTLAAYGVSRSGQFRQRDIRYFIDLFSNWIDPTGQNDLLVSIQNTQIARFVEALIADGKAQQVVSSKQKRYVLVIDGLPALVRQVQGRNYIYSPSVTFFLYLFFTDYFAPYVQGRLQSGPKRYHTILKRLYDVASPGLFIETQLFHIDARLREFERVFLIQRDTDALLAESEGTVPAGELLEDTESAGAFFLHSEKPLKKLLSRGGYDRIEWEATEGRHHRLQLLWQSELSRLQLFRKQLQEIR